MPLGLRPISDGPISSLPASGGAVTHTATGALTADGAVIAGVAARLALHSTSGALVGQNSTLSGSASRFRAFDTSGALTGGGATVSGAANRFRAFSTSGALLGDGAVIAGTATHSSVGLHDASGALLGDGALLSGVASLTFGQPSATSTPGFIERIPTFFKVEPEDEKRKRRASYEAPVQVPQETDQFQAYAQKSAKLAKAVKRLNAEAEALRTQIAAVQAQIEAEEQAKKRAALERRLMLAQQALTLAIAQERAIAEEMEVLDIAFFAMLALTTIH